MLMQDPSRSQEVITQVLHQAEQVVHEKEAILTILQQLDPQRSYSYSELASALEYATHPETEPYEYEETKKVRSAARRIFSVLSLIIVLLPPTCSLLFYMLFSHEYHYPDVSFLILGIALLLLLPSASVVILSKLQFPRKKLVKGIALILSVLLLPWNCLFSSGIVLGSHTDKIKNYLKFDPYCAANRNAFLWELFPRWPERKDELYDYRSHYSCYDVFAQWSLEANEFEQEVARSTALFAAHKTNDEFGAKYDTITMQKGSYTCLVLYDTKHGNLPFREKPEGHSSTETYYYAIFAYDPQNRTVRYICCEGELYCTDQPYYLSLEW